MNIKKLSYPGLTTIALLSVIFLGSCTSHGESNSIENQVYVPVPDVAQTDGFKVGVFRCPLWYEKTRPNAWEPIKRFPERTPLLGYYNEADPEFVDWEIKFARENGISFFVECWYRKAENRGQSPVEDTLNHWLHQGFFHSRYMDMMEFAILWENENRLSAGAEGMDDLINNLMPYWIKNYFSKPNYLQVDGQPFLIIYGPPQFISDMGGVDAARLAIAKMKETARQAGLGGLYVVGEYHETLHAEISFIKEAGFDAITSYHWPSFSGLMPVVPETQREIVDFQEQCWSKLKEISGLPAITAISVGWDSEPWGFTYYKGQWTLTPDYFRQLCERAKRYNLENPDPVSNLILIDNWNEFGEGHYIFPTRQYGFGHLTAIRNTFSVSNPHHIDILPEDIGLGPYIYRKED